MNRKVLAVLGLLVALLIVAITALLAAAKPAADVPLELAKGLLTLVVALLVTGGLGYVLSERRRADDKRAGDERLLVGAFQDLKAAHEQVQVVHLRLRTDRSLIQLREQMDVMIEVRARLQRLRHDLPIRDDSGMVDEIKRMTNYLRELAQEYADHFPHVESVCLSWEVDYQRMLRSEEVVPRRPVLDGNQFPKATMFIDEFVTSEFHEGYRAARLKMEEKLSSLKRYDRGPV